MAKIVTDTYDIDISAISKKMGLTVKQQRELQKELTKVQNEFKKGQKSGESFLGSLIKFNVVSGIFRAITMSIGGAIKGLVSYNKEMAKLLAITNASKEEQAALRKTAEDLGKSTAFTAAEVVKLQQEYAKLGFSVDEINAMSKATVDLAVFTEDTAATAQTAGATLKAFGLQAKDSQRLIDLMAASFNKSALDLGKFQESMKLAAPIAKAFGISVEETTAMLGALANVGISGSLAGTGLRNVLSQLSDESSNVSEVLGGTATTFEEMIKLFVDAKARGQEFNEDALANLDQRVKGVVINLVNNVDALKDLDAEFGNVTGTAKTMADTAIDNLEGSFTLLNSAISGLVNDKGTGTYQALNSIVKSSIPLVGWLGKNFVNVATVAITAVMIPAVKALWGWMTALAIKTTAATAGLNILLAGAIAFVSSRVLKKMTEDQSDLNNEIDKFNKNSKDYTTNLKNMNDALLQENLNEALKKIKDLRKQLRLSPGDTGLIEELSVLEKIVTSLSGEGLSRIKKSLEDLKTTAKESSNVFSVSPESPDYSTPFPELETPEKQEIELTPEEEMEVVEAQMEMLTEKHELEMEQGQELIDLEMALDEAKKAGFDEDIRRAKEKSELKKKEITQTRALNKAILGSTVELLSALGSKNKGFFVATQIARLGEIWMNTAVANTKIAAEWAWNPPVAATLTGKNTANGWLQAGIVAAQAVPEFATGVVNLQGAGTGTSDSIPARLSKGESVATAAATAAGQNASIIGSMNGGNAYTNASGILSEMNSNIKGLTAVMASKEFSFTLEQDVTRDGLTSAVMEGSSEFTNDNNKTELESEV